MKLTVDLPVKTWKNKNNCAYLTFQNNKGQPKIISMFTVSGCNGFIEDICSLTVNFSPWVTVFLEKADAL